MLPRSVSRISLAKPCKCLQQPLGAQRTFFELFRRKQESHESYVNQIRKAVESQDRDALLDIYPKYAKYRRQHPVPSTSSSAPSSAVNPSLDDMLAVLKTFVYGQKRLSDRQYRFVKRIFTDMERQYSQIRSVQAHHYLLLAMVRADRPEEAFRWIKSMLTSHAVVPGVQDWNVVLHGYATGSRSGSKAAPLRYSLADFERVWQALQDSGTNPDQISYNSYVQALLFYRQLERVPAILEDMQAAIGGEDSYTFAILINGYLDAGLPEMADMYAERLFQLVEGPQGNSVTRGSWNTLVKHAAVSGGSTKMDTVLRLWQSKSIKAKPDEWTLAEMLLCPAPSLYEDQLPPDQNAYTRVQAAAARIDVDMTNYAFGIMIQQLLDQAPNTEAGLAFAKLLYDRATTGPEAVQPSSAMVDPILRVLAASSTPDLAMCKSLYQDLVDPIETDRFQSAHLPDEGIYTVLLDCCAKSGSDGFAWALTLLEEMRQAGFNFTSPTVALDQIHRLMACCSNHAEAFKIYAWVQAFEPHTLDRKFYNPILALFSSLKYDQSPTAPPLIFLEVLKDMRASGHSPNTMTYTILLNYYSHQAIRPEQIKRLHDIIKLDPLYDPDVKLNNALMTAYSRVGLHRAAMQVWKVMLLNQKNIDEASISIVLDVCGWSGQKEFAYSTWHALRNDPEIKLNKRHWDTWVENLGRLREIKSACRAVCDQMGHDQAPAADGTTAEVLVKFAKRDGEDSFHYVRKRLQEELPALWDGLSEGLKAEEDYAKPSGERRIRSDTFSAVEVQPASTFMGMTTNALGWGR